MKHSISSVNAVGSKIPLSPDGLIEFAKLSQTTDWANLEHLSHYLQREIAFVWLMTANATCLRADILTVAHTTFEYSGLASIRLRLAFLGLFSFQFLIRFRFLELVIE